MNDSTAETEERLAGLPEKRKQEVLGLLKEIKRLKGKTGFDVLMEQKEKNVLAVEDYLERHPTASRADISEELKISIRSVSRYLAVLRKVKKIETQADIQIKQKAARIRKLQRLVYEHPEYDRDRLAKELDVAKSTLLKYLRELPRVEG